MLFVDLVHCILLFALRLSRPSCNQVVSDCFWNIKLTYLPYLQTDGQTDGHWYRSISARRIYYISRAKNAPHGALLVRGTLREIESGRRAPRCCWVWETRPRVVCECQWAKDAPRPAPPVWRLANWFICLRTYGLRTNSSIVIKPSKLTATAATTTPNFSRLVQLVS